MKKAEKEAFTWADKRNPVYLNDSVVLDAASFAKIRIVGDGTTNNTHLFDQVTGEEIHRISKVTIVGDASKHNFRAKLEVETLSLDLEAFVEEIKIGNTIYRAVKNEQEKE